MNDNKLNVSVRCSKCGYKVLDKVSATSGKIAIKCTRCRSIVEIDLSLRKRSYRKYSFN